MENKLDEVPPMTPVRSSNLTAVGYKDNALYVQFSQGAIYRYDNVPIAAHKALLLTPSKGQFFAKNIKDKFKSVAL